MTVALMLLTTATAWAKDLPAADGNGNVTLEAGNDYTVSGNVTITGNINATGNGEINLTVSEGVTLTVANITKEDGVQLHLYINGTFSLGRYLVKTSDQAIRVDVNGGNNYKDTNHCDFTLNDGGDTYYCFIANANATVALQWNHALGIAVFRYDNGDARFTVTKSDASVVSVTYGYDDTYGGHQGDASFTMPAGDVTVSARVCMPVPYIDANGNPAVCRDNTILTSDGDGDDLPGGWYVATGEFTRYNNLHFAEDNDVHLILCDDANITFYGCANNAIKCSNLTIYGQSNGTGILTSNDYLDAIKVGSNLTICGGHVTATATNGNAITVDGGAINLYGGTLTATADGTNRGIALYGTLCLKGGTVASTGEIYAENGATITLASGLCYTDGTNIYTTSISRSDLLALGSVTLTPAQLYTVTLDQQGGEGGTPSVSAAYGVAMPAITIPTKTGYDFDGYFTEPDGGGTQYYNADGSSAKTCDLTAATTLYAKWDIIQFVVGGLRYKWNDAVPNSVMVIDCELGDNESITIPNTVEHNGVTYDVTAIGDDAFWNKTTLTSIVFPAKLVSIGSRAFKGCTNLSVTIPVGVTLGGEAFNGVYKVTSLLADNADNSALISSYIGAVMNVSDTNITLSGRTLLKDGSWNTLCLPFSLTASNIANSPLAGAIIKELDNSADGTNLTNGTLMLKFTDATEIEAGKPYIVKWETKGDAITNPTFRDPAFDNSAEAQANMTVTSYDQNVKFVGQWSPFTIGDTSNGTYDGDINEILYIASGNKIGYSSKARTLKSCRAHFWVKPNGTDAPAVNTINVDFGEETTGVNEVIEVNASLEVNDNSWYTLDGRKIANGQQPTAKGLYINNGRKVVIK